MSEQYLIPKCYRGLDLDIPKYTGKACHKIYNSKIVLNIPKGAHYFAVELITRPNLMLAYFNKDGMNVGKQLLESKIGMISLRQRLDKKFKKKFLVDILAGNKNKQQTIKDKL